MEGHARIKEVDNTVACYTAAEFDLTRTTRAAAVEQMMTAEILKRPKCGVVRMLVSASPEKAVSWKPSRQQAVRRYMNTAPATEPRPIREMATRTRVAAATVGPAEPREIVTHSVQPATPKARPPHSAVRGDAAGFADGKDMHQEIGRTCARPYSGMSKSRRITALALSCEIRSKGFVEGIRDRRQVTRAAGILDPKGT